MILFGTLVLVLSSTCFAHPSPQHESSFGIDGSAILQPFSGVGDAVDASVKSVAASKVVTFSPSFPDSGRKYAVLEQKSLESFPIQMDIKYGNLQKFVAGIVNPKPIVDQIEEHEKYGNDGGKNRAFATAVVGGYEAFSNLINAAVEYPFNKARELTKSATTSLNTLGGKLVGLS